MSLATQARYQAWVQGVFTGRGRGLIELLPRAGGIPIPVVTAWCRQHDLPNHALPRDLNADQWAQLHALSDRTRRS